MAVVPILNLHLGLPMIHREFSLRRTRHPNFGQRQANAAREPIADRLFKTAQFKTRRLAAQTATATAVFIWFATFARAADLAPPAPPVLTQGNPWEGFYGGGHVGYVFAGSSAFATDPPGGVPSSGETSVVGVEHIDTAHEMGPLTAGLDAGYNFVMPSGLLFGPVVDFSFPGILRSNLQQDITTLGPSVINNNVQIYGSLGGRIGYTFGDWLVYGSGGFAYSRDQLTTTDYATGNVDDNLYFWRPGWTAGAGVEAFLTSNLSASLEYDFFDYAHTGVYLPAAAEHYNSNLTFQTIRAGLNYHFGDNPFASLTAPGSGTTAAPATIGGLLPQSIRDNLSIHGQTTIIGQGYPAFHSAYSGPNSLYAGGEVRDTWSLTGFFGFKDPIEGTEIYYDPEPFQGFGFSDTHGLASFTNIEAQKAGYNFPHYNTARLFIRHVFGLGGEQEDIPDGDNQVDEKEDISRLTFTFGKLAVGDIFDNNSYSHDGRVQFMNWALVDAGAFNYSADQQGYTWGTSLELNEKDWAARAGYFLLPDVSNGENFDTRLGRRGQYIAEIQHNYSIGSMPGVFRFTAFEEQFNAGSFSDAVAEALATGTTPTLTASRQTRSQFGFVANAELAVTKDLGVFARLSWWNGQSEIIYTDITESVSLGGVLKGTSWGRPDDTVGLAAAVSGISNSYIRYLQLGGLGVNIGDGALSYGPESVVETYYSYALTPHVFFTGDYQFALNPGFNTVRGPVNVISARLHIEF
ncbi:MAG: carbohydrate porin [Pseudomonadota bacterium]